jgi:hypothetical protein
MVGSLRSLGMAARKVHLIARRGAAERRKKFSLGREPRESECQPNTEPP